MAGLGALLLAALPGCGEGERMQTGTQVEITDEMRREAEASGNFLEQQSRPKKGGMAKKVEPPPAEPGGEAAPK
jgi:hypothetical protein